MILIVSPLALKALAKMLRQERGALQGKLEAFAIAPYADHSWAKRLVGSKAVRIRQGDWRAICDVDGNALIVTVVKVGHRREIYE